MQLPPNTPLGLPVFLFDKQGPFVQITFIDNIDIGLRNSTLKDISQILKVITYPRGTIHWQNFKNNRPWVKDIFSEEINLPSHYIKVTAEGAEEIKPS